MKKFKWICGVALVVSAALVWASQASRVMMDGKTVSSSTRVINGAVYVKLADMAKAMDRQVVKRGSNYELIVAGGANMLQGKGGKIGEEIFTGKWKFLVKGVQRTKAYMLKYANSKFEMTAESGMDLAIIECRFKNGLRESVDIYFNGLADTALTDMEEHAYKPKWMDAGGGVADALLPGSAKDFAIVFMVPEGAVLKDLVYSIEPVSLGKYGLTNLRISLRE